MEDMKAKMDVLKKLKSDASEKMKGGLKGMMPIKKVSVMSDSAQGLKAGLDKAEDVVSPEAEVSKVDAIMTSAEDLSPEECDELIQKLTAKKEESTSEYSEEESEEEGNPFAGM